jgi:glycosyltransferase involved in cell wall biosynthesis
MEVTVLIATCNRAPLLARTLDSLARLKVGPDIRWDVIVVDNNSCDDTARVVAHRATAFPVPLRRVFESRQGKAHATNAGLSRSKADVVAFTDDDVQVPTNWLEVGTRPLRERADIDYTGGPVDPLWEAPPPAWIDTSSGILRGPIALLDYGNDPFIFEERQRIAMGVNMAVRRAAIDRVGGFHAALDRKGASLLGQGQAEFFFRTRSAGIKGLYVPEMRVRHHVPVRRMSLSYFRRWWYWKGAARARMQTLHPVSELGVDLNAVPHIARLPRFMWRSAAADALGWITASLRSDRTRRLERAMMLVYFTGYFIHRLRGGSLEPMAARTDSPPLMVQ